MQDAFMTQKLNNTISQMMQTTIIEHTLTGKPTRNLIDMSKTLCLGIY